MLPSEDMHIIQAFFFFSIFFFLKFKTIMYIQILNMLLKFGKVNALRVVIIFSSIFAFRMKRM